ncbi:MAG: ABC transporter permease, partial [Micromonosporaceae bacterium]|nr:ABC transporter permease [Micromonosporaceae bacterium]
EDCEEITPPPLESFDPEWFMKPAFDFKESFEGMIITFSAILALVGFLIGASYVGAEWASGGMMNLLLWRPRRLQVLSTKLAALVGSILGVTVVLGALWTAACWAIAVWRGTTAGLTSGVWQSFALTGLRGLALVLVGTVVGFAIASIGRHTAMALGVVIALAVVGQFGLAIVLELANVDFPERWLLPYYGAAWMMRKYVMTDYSSCGFSVGGECVLETQTITWQHAGLLFGVATVVLVIVAAWTMRRRDIT